MDFKNMLQRADLNSIRAFLKNGTEDFCEKTDLTYSEQIKETIKNIHGILKEKYPTFEEYDKIEGYFNEQLFILENIYFEIGLLAGAKIAFQISERFDEIK